MKKAAAFLVVWTILTTIPVTKTQAQSEFEGTITMTTSGIGDGEKHDVLINMKGSRMEIDIDAGAQGHFKLYPDMQKHKLYLVMAGQQTGMEQTLPEKNGTSKAQLKPLGKKDTIAGHPAEAYELTTPEADITLWETSDLPASIRKAYQAALPHILREDDQMIAALDEFSEKKMAPVRIDLSIKQLGQNITLELSKIEQKKMDDAIFVLPKDITFQPMPQMPADNPDEGNTHQ